MKISLFLVLCISLTLSSCGLFTTAETYDPYSTIPETREEIMQDSIKSMVANKMANGKPYKAFGFSTLKVIKPIELKKLDSLFALKYKLSNSTNSESVLKLDKIDQLIATQKKDIKSKDLHSKYIMEHIFTIGDGNSAIVYEYDFTFVHTYKIEDVRRKMEVTLTEKFTEIFYHYFYQYPISSNNSTDQNFYDTFRSKLESINSSTEKSAFMRHTLKILDLSIIKSNVSLDYLSKQAISEYFKLEKSYYKNYKPLKFSEFRGRYAVLNGNETLIGWEVDHLLNYQSEDKTKEVGLRFYIDIYYQISEIYELDTPYEKYFE